MSPRSILSRAMTYAPGAVDLRLQAGAAPVDAGVALANITLYGRDGRVFERSFFADYAERESVNDMLQESYRVLDLERGEVQTQVTPHLEARVYFSSPTLVFDLALDVLPHNWERLN